MSREVSGTAVTDAPREPRPTTATAPAPRTPATTYHRDGRQDRQDREDKDAGTGDPAGPGPGPTDPLLTPRRAVAVLLALCAAVGAVAGWAGTDVWRSGAQREAALRSAAASAVVTGADPTVGGEDAQDRATGVRNVALDVAVTNLGGVPLLVGGNASTFTAVRLRFVEPSDLTVPPGRTRTVRVQVQVGCRSPLVLRMPELRLTSQDGLVGLDVPVDAVAPALAGACDGTLGRTGLVEVSAVPARSDVARLVDGDRLRLSVVAPSGRTTRIVGARVAGLDLFGDPLPMTVDGTPRALWLDQPAGCDASVTRSGLPASLDLDVDTGSGQVATVRVPVGAPLVRWLLAGPCAEPPGGAG